VKTPSLLQKVVPRFPLLLSALVILCYLQCINFSYDRNQINQILRTGNYALENILVIRFTMLGLKISEFSSHYYYLRWHKEQVELDLLIVYNCS